MAAIRKDAGMSVSVDREKGSLAMRTVKQGDTVKIHFELIHDGQLIQSSRNESPLSLKAGSDDFILGLSEGIIGMSKGQKRSLELAPEKGFGTRDDSLLVSVDRRSLPEKVEMGDVLSTEDEETWVVREVQGDKVILDGNHPLAGRTVRIDVELIDFS
jgi:FKBP-type peptidyl-prolyl cis-trans isomerase 2